MDDAFRILDGDELERLLATEQPAARTCCGETGAHHPSCPVLLWPAFDPGDARVPDVDALLDAELGKVGT